MLIILRFFTIPENLENCDGLTPKCSYQIGEDWTISLSFGEADSSKLNLAIGNNDHLIRVLRPGLYLIQIVINFVFE